MATICKPFTTATIQYLDHADTAEARKWWVNRSLRQMNAHASALATARLNAMNVIFKLRLPWAFSLARATQQPALKNWQGEESSVLAAQQALSHRASFNGASSRGEYNAATDQNISATRTNPQLTKPRGIAKARRYSGNDGSNTQLFSA